MKPKIITIIPARGGSKGIPHKNIVKIAGKHLIGWTIEQSINTSMVAKTYVTTNDPEIAEISRQYGASIIQRPDNISTDTATSEEAIIHALHYIQENDTIVPDYVVFLQATSPLRLPDDVSKAVKKIIKKDADSLLSGSTFNDILFWENNNGIWESINYDYQNRGRRQDRAPQFIENGSIYIFKPEIIRKFNNRIGGKLALYEMNFWQTWQIDTAEDIELVEFYLKKNVKQQACIVPSDIELIVYDFDGVMTNNKALVDQSGVESVFVNRSDGLAISEIKKMNIPQIIISTEKNPVIQRRAEKLNIPFIQGVDNKKEILKKYAQTNSIELKKIVYLGNDINDSEAMSSVGIGISPADGVAEIKDIAKIILTKNGGEGVIRELFDLLRNNQEKNQ